MKFKKISELTRGIKKILQEDGEFPKELVLDQGMEFNEYRIKIEIAERDHYIDSNGDKWIKQK